LPVVAFREVVFLLWREYVVIASRVTSRFAAGAGHTQNDADESRGVAGWKRRAVGGSN
jgi:hypothetical protein